MIIVITGKTASGKDTIIRSILTKFPDLKKIITTTSRTPRANEINGKDYHFLSRDEFSEKIASGDFLEYVEYGGNLYGTERHEFKGKEILWKIDPSMAGKVKQLLSEESVVIYVTTKGDVILQRLKERGLSDGEINQRMEDDRRIWNEYHKSYDYVLENIPGELEQTVDKVAQIIGKT